MVQDFQILDIFILFLLFILEAILAIDNSVALAVVTKTIPQKKRKKALFIGIFSNFILRAFVIFFAYFILEVAAIQIIGGLYLIYLCISHLMTHKKSPTTDNGSFWVCVFKIECLDFIFAIDSIMSAFSLLAFFYSPQIIPTKLWMIYVAGIFGMVKIRLISSWMIKLIERYPLIEKLSHLIIGWLGIKLLVMALEHVFDWNLNHTLMNWLFWVGLFALVILYWVNYRKRKRSRT